MLLPNILISWPPTLYRFTEIHYHTLIFWYLPIQWYTDMCLHGDMLLPNILIFWPPTFYRFTEIYYHTLIFWYLPIQ